jgi:hypothetical protein
MQDEECRRKLCHTDYLSALWQARRLAEENISIYPCNVCNGLHLGHDRLRYAAHCDREGRAKVNSLLRRIRVHESVIAKHIVATCSLRMELENTLIEYGFGDDAV